jgi:hypothetical protein
MLEKYYHGYHGNDLDNVYVGLGCVMVSCDIRKKVTALGESTSNLDEAGKWVGVRLG